MASQPAPPVRSEVDSPRQYASWGRRALAYIVDNVILAVPAGIVLAVLIADESGVVATLFLLVWFVLPVAYFAYFHGSARGQTPGKRLMRIRVRADDGERPLGFGRGLGRYLMVLVFGWFVIPLVLDFLWPLWDERNQSLHDKVAGSVVVPA